VRMEGSDAGQERISEDSEEAADETVKVQGKGGKPEDAFSRPARPAKKHAVLRRPYRPAWSGARVAEVSVEWILDLVRSKGRSAAVICQ